MFDTIYEDMFYLKSELKLPICLIGDMNAHTGNLDDTLDFEHVVINNSETNDFAEDLFNINLIHRDSIINKKKRLTQIKQSIKMVKHS